MVILTGAGISAESGIKTFRDHNGLWEDHRIEDVASPEGFARDPEMVQHFYNMRRKQLLSDEVKPNLAHDALAQFEKNFSGEFTLITQNVDNLHEEAGSQKVLHMHGELLKVRCVACDHIYQTTEDLKTDSPCPNCEKIGQLRPHIVWFGEIPFYMSQIEKALKTCEVFISIGTSALVYPAAGFFQLASSYGAHTIECNLESTQASDHFNKNFFGKATKAVPKLFAT